MKLNVSVKILQAKMATIGGVRISQRAFRLLGWRFNRIQLFQTSSVASQNFSDGDHDVSKQYSNAVSALDPAPLFFNSEVQTILKRVTGLDLKKIFRKRHNPLRQPKYELMTDEQLNQAKEKGLRNALKRLQMPPVLKAREPVDEVISSDPELKGYNSAKYIFVDISHNVSDRDRLVLSRHPDGTLRRASWEDHERMVQIFSPQPGKEVEMPTMFEDEFLQDVLERGHTEFILDRACLQFEPDDPEYIRVTKKVYGYIDQNRKYEELRSTRHFGPMAFHLALHKHMDNLVIHLIQNDRFSDAVDMIKLFHILHPYCQSKQVTKEDSDELSVVKLYIQNDATKRSALELVLQTYEELQQRNSEYSKVVHEVHSVG